jgi:hypothetical protein
MVGNAKDENARPRSGFEAIDRLDESDRRDLLEVVDVLHVATALGELARERHEPLRDGIPGRRAAIARKSRE